MVLLGFLGVEVGVVLSCLVGSMDALADLTELGAYLNCWYSVKDCESFNESMRCIDQCDLAALIPCHGDVIEGDAK